MDTLGKHIILEMWGCSKNVIDSIDQVKDALTKTAKTTKANLVNVVCHRFSPYGITGVAVLAESHISVHTWPEYEYAAVDIFICGSVVNSQDAASYITQAFHAKDISLLELKRGDLLSKKLQESRLEEAGINPLI